MVLISFKKNRLIEFEVFKKYLKSNFEDNHLLLWNGGKIIVNSNFGGNYYDNFKGKSS